MFLLKIVPHLKKNTQDDLYQSEYIYYFPQDKKYFQYPPKSIFSFYLIFLLPITKMLQFLFLHQWFPPHKGRS